MSKTKKLTGVAAALFAVALIAPNAPAEAASKPAWTKNCTALHKKYPHGVGRVNAKDKTSGTPVKTFKKSNKLFATAMKYNKGLDRDKDKIACEQK